MNHRYDTHERVAPQPTSKHVSAAVARPPKVTRRSVNPIAKPAVNHTHNFPESFLKRVNEYAHRPRVNPTINRFENCLLVSPLPPSKTEWTDKQPGPKKTILLRHLPLDQLLNLARKTFQEIHGNITEQTAGSLLVLAYNIMNNEGEYLTAKSCLDLIDTASSINLEEMSHMIFRKGCGKTIRAISRDFDEHKDLKLCIAYTYLAASYLRLFTKPAENYLKLGNHLKTSFQNFYPFVFPLDNFHPDLNTIEFIHHKFKFREILKNTFYVFLYASCENTEGKALKNFLYVSHVSYTGIDCYTLFLKVMDALNKDNITLANRLYSPGFEPYLDEIMNVFTNLVKAKEGHDLQMWRFGRISDSAFLSVFAWGTL